MPLYYNGTAIKKLYFNGTKISKAFYNGTQVFSDEYVIYDYGTTYTGYASGTYQNSGGITYGADFINVEGRGIMMFGPVNLSEYSSLALTCSSTVKGNNTIKFGIVNPNYAPPNLGDWKYINDYDSNFLALTRIAASDFGSGTGIRTYTCNIANAVRSNVCILVSVDIGMSLAIDRIVAS